MHILVQFSVLFSRIISDVMRFSYEGVSVDFHSNTYCNRVSTSVIALKCRLIVSDMKTAIAVHLKIVDITTITVKIGSY